MKTSVALCTYNGEKFLKEQIDSILFQTVPVNEIVVCDDGSTDKTIEILNVYKEKYPNVFRIYQNEKNLRSVKNFEKALSLCQNEIIFLSDQDDVWLPEKTEIYIQYFIDHPEIEVIASNGFAIDDQDEVLDLYSFWDFPLVVGASNKSVTINDVITKSMNIATGASMALRKVFLNEVIPFPSGPNLYHDEWIAFVSASKNNFLFLNEKLFYYRIHQEQQIGGVFFPKEKESILFLERTFGLKDDFVGLKKNIKRLCDSFKRNSLYLQLQPRHHEFIQKNKEEIKKRILIKKVLFKNKYPIRSRILLMFDFKNKRNI